MITTILITTLAQSVALTPSTEAGRNVRTEIRCTQDYLMESFVEQVGDQSRSQGASGAISTEMYIGFEDEYTTGDVVRRHFEEIDFKSKSVMTTPQGESQTENLKFASLFESYDILFTWIEAEQQYGRRYDRVGATEEPLKHLRFVADGRSILPAGDVSVGTTWEVDGAALARLVAPGGGLALQPEKRSILGRSIKMGVGAALSEMFNEESLGRAVCQFAEMRTGEDGSDLAVIKIQELTLQSIVDQTRTYEKLMSRQEKREPAFLEGAISDVQLMNGEGTLIWNVTAGRLESYEIQADQRLIITVQKQFGETVGEGEEGMQAVTRIQSVAYAGLLKLDVKGIETPQ